MLCYTKATGPTRTYDIALVSFTIHKRDPVPFLLSGFRDVSIL